MSRTRPGGSPRPGLAGALLLASAALAMGSTRADETAAAELRAGTPAAELVALVREARETQPGDLPALETRLALVVPRALDGVSGMLMSRRVPEWEGEAAQVLSEPQTELLMRAVSGVERRLLEAELARLEAAASEEGGPGVAARCASIRLLGAAGGADDLSRILGLALTDQEESLEPRLERVAQGSVAAILERQPEGFALLSALRARLRPVLIPALTRAAGATGDARGLELLHAIAAARREHVRLAMSQLSRLRPVPWSDTSARFAALARPYLDPSRPSDCKAAATALAALGDDEAVDDLITLVADSDRGIAGTAHWALRELTGMPFPADPAIWKHWYDSERVWFHREHPALLQQLESPRLADAARAVHELARHRLRRRELAREIAPLSTDGDPRLRAMACAALGELGSCEGIASLVAALGDPEEEVIATALSALVRLTGENLPADPVAWRKAVAAYL